MIPEPPENGNQACLNCFWSIKADMAQMKLTPKVWFVQHYITCMRLKFIAHHKLHNTQNSNDSVSTACSNNWRFNTEPNIWTVINIVFLLFYCQLVNTSLLKCSCIFMGIWNLASLAFVRRFKNICTSGFQKRKEKKRSVFPGRLTKEWKISIESPYCIHIQAFND